MNENVEITYKTDETTMEQTGEYTVTVNGAPAKAEGMVEKLPDAIQFWRAQNGDQYGIVFGGGSGNTDLIFKVLQGGPTF